MTTRKIRVVFEFEDDGPAIEFLDAINAGLESGTLTITGKWLWGAEVVEPIDLQGEEDD